MFVWCINTLSSYLGFNMPLIVLKLKINCFSVVFLLPQFFEWLLLSPSIHKGIAPKSNKKKTKQKKIEQTPPSVSSPFLFQVLFLLSAVFRKTSFNCTPWISNKSKPSAQENIAANENKANSSSLKIMVVMTSIVCCIYWTLHSQKSISTTKVMFLHKKKQTKICIKKQSIELF